VGRAALGASGQRLPLLRRLLELSAAL
jgi:hypothetical protein